VGNRGFFPDHLAKSGREQMISVLSASGYDVVCPDPAETKYGAVETRGEAGKCAALFRANREKIDGIIITLPNFGEERGLVEALRLAGLNVPVLVQATPDTAGKMTIADRRDSFCGKMSACNNLRQYGIPYSLTTLHTEAPSSPEFKKISTGSQQSVVWWAACTTADRRIRQGLRPSIAPLAKLLEANGIAVSRSIFEIFGQ
jgi:L-fucose isomerase-like protein